MVIAVDGTNLLLNPEPYKVSILKPENPPPLTPNLRLSSDLGPSGSLRLECRTWGDVRQNLS